MLQRPESKYILNKLENDLPSHLKYHTIEHTMDVYQITLDIAKKENVSNHELNMLLVAALYHDAGYLIQRKNHEDLSCKMIREVLPQFGYTNADTEKICEIIMATKLPQSPQSRLGEIICDADLDYLGRNDFFETGHRLYQEMLSEGIVANEEEWNQIQIKFLENHLFFTQTSINLREATKQENLNKLRSKTGIQ